MNPYYDVDNSILSQNIFDSWPEDCFRILEGRNRVQKFYNDVYNALKDELEIFLLKFHPAGVIVEGYKQLELWTAIQFEAHKDFDIQGPKIFAPIGRYGWRYIIEKSLERLSDKVEFKELRPSAGDQNKIFTYLLGLSYSSELSNTLHYLGDSLSSVFIEFSPRLLQSIPKFHEPSESTFYKNILDEMMQKTDWSEYSEFQLNSDKITQLVSNFLNNHFGFSFADLTYLIEIIIEKVCNVTGASITVQPYIDFIEMLYELSDLEMEKIESIINLACLDTENISYESRDYLKRSQNIRMLNYCGVALKLTGNFEAIYDERSAKKQFVMSADKHIIISPTMYAEWLDVFVTKIALGQRADLKNIPEYNFELANIERYYHRNIFENQVKNICRNHGYECISIDKINNTPIECGEIDVVAYNQSNGNLLILECKSVVPTIDAKGFGQVMSDHFKQKKYHKKFLKKIMWVETHIKEVSDCFSKQSSAKINQISTIKRIFVTGSFYVAKYFVKDYDVMTFYQLDEFLKIKA